jgi:multisubunit Na+/H+ antiporter MnhE subunit
MMSQLTLNSIPSLDAIERQARTKDRHVQYHALDTCGTFTPGTIWISFHATVVHPTDAAKIRIRVARLILPDIKEYDVRTATNPSS